MTDLMSTEELAQALDVSRTTIERWRRQGEGPPYVRVGPRSIRYRPEDVDDYLEENLQAA